MNKRIWSRSIACFVLILLMFCTGCVQPVPGDQNSTVTTSPETTSESANTEPTGGEEQMEKIYCAVGTVDEAAKTAKVLLGNGEITTLNWTGDKPTSGTVNVFVKDGDSYKVEKARTFPPNGKSFAIWDDTIVSARQKRLWKSEMYFVTNETIFFVRYTDTEWRVFKGRSAIKNDAGTRAYMAFTNEIEETAKVLQYIMVVGDYGDAGQWPAANKHTTQFLDPNGVGWDSGDKDLS